MKILFALTALTYLVAGRPTCPTPRPLSGNSSTPTSTAATGPSTQTPTSASSNSTTNKIATGWWADWSGDPSEIPWNGYQSLKYAFAIPSPDVNKLELPTTSGDDHLVKEFVKQAQSHGVKPMLSVGGWGGSIYFSTSVANPKNRTQFTQTLSNFTDTYGFQGIDIDWEYPAGKNGLTCNTYSPDDTANLLAFLKELRNKTGDGFTLSAAVTMKPFNGPDGQPLKDVSEFAKVLDHIEIMAYDVYGRSGSVAGPNAPLRNSCASQNDQGSCESAVAAWTQAGFPPGKILLGVPMYGHAHTVERSAIGADAQKLAEFPPQAGQAPPGTGEDSNTKSTDLCGVTDGPSGVFNYNDMVQKKFISTDGTAAGGEGLLFDFDDCSQTAYLYNSSSQVLINFDNTETYKAKGKFISEKELAGFAAWTVTYDTPEGALWNAIQAGIGM